MANEVRITSGKYRGRRLLTPGGATHPMGERERLALFNMISSRLAGANVLDAFAGSGALGIEALSRGASDVVFIEKNAEAARVIRGNLRELMAEAEVFKGRVSDYQSDDGREFEVILADPPYDSFDVGEAASLVHLLRPGGVFVLSHPNEAPEIRGLRLVKTNHYARAHISIYELV